MIWTSLVAQTVKDPPAMRETWVWSLGWEDPLEEGMATHSSILAWRTPMDRGAWWTTVHPWGSRESDMTEWLCTAHIWNIYHMHITSFFIHSSLEEYCGSFHVLAIVNNTVKDTVAQTCLQHPDFVPLDVCQQGLLQDCMVVTFPIFWETPILLLHCDCTSLYSSQQIIRVSSPHILAHTCSLIFW